jgi:hypothetical protein
MIGYKRGTEAVDPAYGGMVGEHSMGVEAVA